MYNHKEVYKMNNVIASHVVVVKSFLLN